MILRKKQRPLAMNLNLICLVAPGQISTVEFDDAADMVVMILSHTGIKVDVKRYFYQHPCLELNTLANRYRMLFALKDFAKKVRLPKARCHHFFALKEKFVGGGSATYGQSELGTHRPKVCFSSTDKSPYVTAIAAVHEIAHALNAEHDDSGPNIMSTASVNYAFRGEPLSFNPPAIKAIKECLRAPN